jgi:hypothetical protein
VFTVLFAFGFQVAFAAPVVKSSWAMRLRLWAPIEVNCPPAHSTLPFVASVRTELLEFGFHDVATPVLASAAPTRLRVMPPSVVKSPAA